MENNRKFRSKRPSGSVDGVIHDRSGLRRSRRDVFTPRADQTGTGKQSLLSRNRLDNFKSVEGFHPAQQPDIQADSKLNQRPLGRNPKREIDGKIDLSLNPVEKKNHKKSWKKRLLTKRKLIGVGVFSVLLISFFLAKVFLNLNQIFQGGGGAAALQDNVDPSQLRGEGDGRVNILLLGKGGIGHTAPDLTDTLLVASIDPVNKKAALLSIPRDLWVQPEGLGASKINSVYANAKGQASYQGKKGDDIENAGLDAIDKTVEKYMGIPIHYHVMVDFNGFKKAIDTVGGVDLNVDKNGTVYEVLWDESTGRNYVLNVGEGQQHFDGTRALFYSRSRYTSPRGDFDRTERQRKIILALKDKILSAGTYSNPLKINQLTSDFGNHVRANMSTGELLRLYDISKSINADQVVSLGLADPPKVLVKTGNIGGLSVVIPVAGIDNYDAIRSFVRNSLKDGFIANENAKIIILNGTTIPGVATRRAEELRSFGYNIIKVANAPTQNYSKTQLIDLRNGEKKYTKHYLEGRLKVTATNSLPDSKIVAGDADFVIILGANEGQ